MVAAVVAVGLGEDDPVATDMVDGADMLLVRSDDSHMLANLAEQLALALASGPPIAEIALEPALVLTAIIVIVAIELVQLALPPFAVVRVMEAGCGPAEVTLAFRWTPERQRDFSGAATGLHDPHYSEWRQRQLDELDRDYDDYRRENQSRFESDFGNWRTARQGKRQLLGQVREHMTVVGSDEEHVGTVDHVRSDRIILTKADSDDSRHHVISCSLVDRVEGDRVILDQPAAEAKQRFEHLGRDRAFFRDDERETGPHMLDRAFSGTYER